jgi:hypothetical protein
MKTNSLAIHRECGRQEITYSILNGNYTYICGHCKREIDGRTEVTTAEMLLQELKERADDARAKLIYLAGLNR